MSYRYAWYKCMIFASVCVRESVCVCMYVSHHDLPSLLFSEDEPQSISVGPRHQTQEQRLLPLGQLTHVHLLLSPIAFVQGIFGRVVCYSKLVEQGLDHLSYGVIGADVQGVGGPPGQVEAQIEEEETGGKDRWKRRERENEAARTTEEQKRKKYHGYIILAQQ